MLERQLPALNWATRSSPTDIHDKLLPWGLCNCPPRLCDIPTYVSPVLPGALWEDLVDSPVVQSWCTHACGQERRLSVKMRLHSCNLPFSDEDDCSFPILAALLRVTGLVAECLNHSLCTASPYPLPPTTPPALLDIPPPHVSSVKWKCRTIKNRQPEADHCCTYANVDTEKYHIRRGRKKR